MVKEAQIVAVTGGAGQIAYSLLFRIAHGDMLGYDQPIILSILEIPEALKSLEGVVMELHDCAFPLLSDVRIGSDPKKIFHDAKYALLVGAKPRGPGMERKDLLIENAKIFVEQGKALNDEANPDVKVLVVGNPCNTNCLIAMSHAPRIPRKNFHAMTRLDQNRAVGQLALKGSVDVRDVENVIIWGNHSSTQVPDPFNAKIKGLPAVQEIDDRTWLEDNFIEIIQKRGAAVISARGKSSAASAANAAIDAMKELIKPTPQGKWYSSGVYSENNPYGVDQNLIFSFPCRTERDGRWQIVPNLPWNDFLKKRIQLTEKELIEERELIKDLLPAHV